MHMLRYFDSLQNSSYISCFNSLRMFDLNCFIATSNFILILWKVCKKMKSVGCADPQERSRSVRVLLNDRSQWCLSAWQV